MYVHIGKDTVINSENIIVVLDIESLEKNKKLQDVLQNLKISDNIVDVSEGNKKSLVIINKNKKNMGYITNISTATLGKRAEKYKAKSWNLIYSRNYSNLFNNHIKIRQNRRKMEWKNLIMSMEQSKSKY